MSETKTFPMWKTRKYGEEIKEVKAVRKTVSSVWVEESSWDGNIHINQHPKVSEFSIYHDTRESAVAYLIRRYKGIIDRAEGEIKDAKKELSKLQ